MAEEQATVAHIVAPGISAFTLSQIAFLAVVDSGLLSKAEAIQKLRAAVNANAGGGAANDIAAQLLGRVLADLKKQSVVRRQ